MASTEGKYGAVADYLDSLAGELKQIGIKKVRSFNDPLYYNGDLTTHTWQNIDEAEYWCYNGMNSFRYASPGLLAEQGFGMINGHGDFYDILTGGDDNWKKPVGDAGTKRPRPGFTPSSRTIPLLEIRTWKIRMSSVPPISCGAMTRRRVRSRRWR